MFWLIKPILAILFMILFHEFSNINDIGVAAGIAVILAFVLSPKYKIVQKQNGEEEQMKWLFFKKVINRKI